MTIAEIKEILAQEEISESTMNLILQDERKGVQKLVVSYMKRIERDTQERLRLESMYETESVFYKKGISSVTVAAVILKPHAFFPGLNDSKKVKPSHRVKLAEIIKQQAIAYSIVSVFPEEIDSLNIYGATLTAMYQAVKELQVKAEAVIVDAMPLHLSIPVESLIHGDEKSASVAAASIIAKVHRDQLMDVYDKKYPGYGFKNNKGYGTKEHLEGLYRLGITPIHRKSFEPVKSIITGKEYYNK